MLHKGGSRAIIINLFLFVFFCGLRLVILDCQPQNRAELLLSDNRTIDFLTKLWWTGLYSVFIDTALRTSKRKCHGVEYDQSHFSPVRDQELASFFFLQKCKNLAVYTLKSLSHQPISGFYGRLASLEQFQIRDNDLMLRNDIIIYQSYRKFANLSFFFLVKKIIFAVRLCHVNGALSSP